MAKRKKRLLVDPDEYWSEDPDFPLDDWKYEVKDDSTRLGYWEWVAQRKGLN